MRSNLGLGLTVEALFLAARRGAFLGAVVLLRQLGGRGLAIFEIVVALAQQSWNNYSNMLGFVAPAPQLGAGPARLNSNLAF